MLMSPYNMIKLGVVTHPHFSSIDSWKSRNLITEHGIAIVPMVIQKVITNENSLVTLDIQTEPVDQVQISDNNKNKALGWKLEPGLYECEGEIHLRIPAPGLIGQVHPWYMSTAVGIEVLEATYGIGTDSTLKFLVRIHQPIIIPAFVALGEIRFSSQDVVQHTQPKVVGQTGSYDNSRSFA